MLIVGGYIYCSSALLNRLSLRQYQVLAGVTVYLAPPHPTLGSSPPPTTPLPHPTTTQENLANSIQNNIYFL